MLTLPYSSPRVRHHYHLVMTCWIVRELIHSSSVDSTEYHVSLGYVTSCPSISLHVF